MRLITCYKLVPEEQDIAISADRTLITDHAGEKISPFDLNASKRLFSWLAIMTK